MKCRIKNLFPDDTRIVEILSALIMLSTYLIYMIEYITGRGIHKSNIENWDSWLAASAVVATVQLSTLFFAEETSKLRIYSSLLMGGLLTYFGFMRFSVSTISFVTLTLLGIANLYAFFVNDLLSKRQSWK